MHLRSGTILPTGGEQDSSHEQADQLLAQQLNTFQRVAELCNAVMDHMGTRAGEPQLLPPATLPTYTGYDDPKSVADFLEEMDRYVRATGASEAHVMARILPLALRDAAGRWWRLQTPFTTWAEFEQRFREEFLPPGYELRVQRELELRTQHPDESLLEYVRTMQELHRRAAPTASERDQVARVIRQSHPRFRPFLYGRTFETLEHLAREARGVQDALLAESTYVPPPAPQSALEPSLAWRAPVASPSCDLTSPGAFTAISSRALDPFAHEQGRRGAPLNTVSGVSCPWEQVSAEQRHSAERSLLTRAIQEHSRSDPQSRYAGFTSPARADCDRRSCYGYSGSHSAERRDFSDRVTGQRRHTHVVCYQCGQTGHVRRQCFARRSANAGSENCFGRRH